MPDSHPEAPRKASPAREDVSAEPTAPPKIIKPQRRTLIIMAFVALAGVLLILSAWRIWPFNNGLMRTDNSYVRGKMTVLAPQVSGYVTGVLVRDYETVKAGQPLVRIDPRNYLTKRDEAAGQLKNAQAELAKSHQTLAQNRATIGARTADLEAVKAENQRSLLDEKRVRRLAENGSVSTRERDQAVAQARLARANVAKAEADLSIAVETEKSTQVAQEGLAAQVEIAQARLRQAEIDLSNTVIVAPRNGTLGEASVRQGQYVTAGSQLMYLVPDDIWVVANFKETQIHNMQKGMRVTFSVDALGGATLSGHISDFSPATGSEFSLLRADNASGNFTKVVQRLPVKIVVDKGQPLFGHLRPGMSVETSVDTQQQPGESEK